MATNQQNPSVYFKSFLSRYVIPFSIIEEKPNKKDIDKFLDKLKNITYTLPKGEYNVYLELLPDVFKKIKKTVERIPLLDYERKNERIRIFKRQEIKNITGFLCEKFPEATFTEKSINDKKTIVCSSNDTNIYKRTPHMLDRYGDYIIQKINTGEKEELHIRKSEPFEKIIEKIKQIAGIKVSNVNINKDKANINIENTEEELTRNKEELSKLEKDFPNIQIDTNKTSIELTDVEPFDYAKSLLDDKKIRYEIEEKKSSENLIGVWEEKKFTYKKGDYNKEFATIDQTRFLLNPIEETLFYKDKFHYLKLTDEGKNHIVNNRGRLVILKKKDGDKYTEISYLEENEYDLDIDLVVSYTGICFLIFNLKSTKNTPVDILLNFNYYFSKIDEFDENIFIAFLKEKNNEYEIMSINKDIPTKTINGKPVIISKDEKDRNKSNILNDIILGKEISSYLDINNINKRLYDRPIVYSYVVYCEDENHIIPPRGMLGDGFNIKHRFSRGLSAQMHRKAPTSFDEEGIKQIFFDEDTFAALQPDFVCFYINGWDNYNISGLPAKLSNVYFYVFLLVLTQFYTLNYFTYNHSHARNKGNTKAIQKFVTLIRRYKIELLFDMVSLNTNLERFYEGLWEKYKIVNHIKNVENNLSVDENKIDQNNEKSINTILFVLTFVGIPLGAITEMIQPLIDSCEKSIMDCDFDHVGWIIIFIILVLDIGFIALWFFKRNKIST